MITPKHGEWLEDHAVSTAFAEKWGVKSVGKKLAFPWRDGTREVCQTKDLESGDYRFPKDTGTIVNHIKPPSPGAKGLFIVEGTKQSLAIAALLEGLPLGVYGIAGVNNWKPHQLGFAAGFRVMVAFDADRNANPQVAKAAADLRAALLKAGAEGVGFISCPGFKTEAWDDVLARTLPEKRRDLWFAAVEAAADAADAGEQGGHLRVTRASEIEPESSRWMWEPDSESKWLPLDALTLLAGREGIGKSSIAFDIAAKVTTGMLPGEFMGTPRNVIIAATEDSWAATITPRLMAAGADRSRIIRVESVSSEGFVSQVSLPNDVAELERLILAEDVALVIIDPLMSAIDGKLDTHNDGAVRRGLEPISRLAHETGVSVMGLIHLSKARDGDLMTRIMASRAFGAVARAVLFCLKEEPEIGSVGGSESFLFAQVKNNLAAKPPYSWRYTIAGVGVDEAKSIYSSRIAWGERVDAAKEGSLQDIATRQETRTPEKETAADRAARWLVEYLEEHGPTPSAEVKLAGEASGHGEKSLARVRARVGVVTTSRATSAGRETIWSLPSCPDVLDVPNVPDVDRPPSGTSVHQDSPREGVPTPSGVTP